MDMVWPDILSHTEDESSLGLALIWAAPGPETVAICGSPQSLVWIDGGWRPFSIPSKLLPSVDPWMCVCMCER